MVSYFNQDIDFKLKEKSLNNKWLKLVAESEVKKLGNLSFIFCSDPNILDINIKYLGHDYYTDIITFDYTEDNVISGDLFISIDTVKENACLYSGSFEDELDRVMVHGVLHLIGYDDHADDDIKTMRAKEDYYIGLKRKLQGK